jgi:hypothetical protein
MPRYVPAIHLILIRPIAGVNTADGKERLPVAAFHPKRPEADRPRSVDGDVDHQLGAVFGLDRVGRPAAIVCPPMHLLSSLRCALGGDGVETDPHLAAE